MCAQGPPAAYILLRLKAIRECYASYEEDSALCTIGQELSVISSSFVGDPDVQASLCKTISHLAGKNSEKLDTVRALVATGALAAIMRALDEFSSDDEVVKHAFEALLSLLKGSAFYFRQRILEGIQAIPGAMERLLQYIHASTQDDGRYRYNKISKAELQSLQQLLDNAISEVCTSLFIVLMPALMSSRHLLANCSLRDVCAETLLAYVGRHFRTRGADQSVNVLDRFLG